MLLSYRVGHCDRYDMLWEVKQIESAIEYNSSFFEFIGDSLEVNYELRTKIVQLQHQLSAVQRKRRRECVNG